MSEKQFQLTDEHILLLQAAYVGWNDDCGEGTPCFDQKRPYGNSDVVGDIAKLLEIEPLIDDDGEEHWPPGTRDRCMALHRETGMALEVVLSAKSFEPGIYTCAKYGKNWRRVSA